MIREFHIFCPYDISIINGLYALFNSPSFMTAQECVNNERDLKRGRDWCPGDIRGALGHRVSFGGWSQAPFSQSMTSPPADSSSHQLPSPTSYNTTTILPLSYIYANGHSAVKFRFYKQNQPTVTPTNVTS